MLFVCFVCFVVNRPNPKSEIRPPFSFQLSAFSFCSLRPLCSLWLFIIRAIREIRGHFRFSAFSFQVSAFVFTAFRILLVFAGAEGELDSGLGLGHFGTMSYLLTSELKQRTGKILDAAVRKPQFIVRNGGLTDLNLPCHLLIFSHVKSD